MGDAYEQRPGQTDMAHHVLDSLNQGEHLILEAGTGVGKSLGYLAPAAIWSRQNEQKVVIATNTIALQDQLIEKDIPQMQALLPMLGIQPVKATLLKGRRNYLCTRRLHEWVGDRQLSPQELSVLARVLVWLPTTRTGDVGELFLPSPTDKAIWDRICSDGDDLHAGALHGPRRHPRLLLRGAQPGRRRAPVGRQPCAADRRPGSREARPARLRTGHRG